MIKSDIFHLVTNLDCICTHHLGEPGDGKKMGSGAPWYGLSMGVVFVGIRGSLNLITEVNDSENC